MRKRVVLALTILLSLTFIFLGEARVYLANEPDVNSKFLENPKQAIDKKLILTIDKSVMKESHKKLSSDLLQLIDGDYIPPGTTREKIREQMKGQKQLIAAGGSSGEVVNRSNEDLAYVYIRMGVDSSIDTIKSYASKLTDWDDKNYLAVAWVPVSKLESLASLKGVLGIQTVIPPVTRVGSVTSEGDSILRTDQFRESVGADGSGIKVGIIANGVDHWTVSRNSGDLPADLNVLSNSVGGDEGTAMLEIVHDSAPGAELYFHDRGTNIVAFNSAIDELLAAGCNVICDDIGWIQEPFFEDGTVAKHIDSLLSSNNFVYVSAAGNDACTHYQGTFHSLDSGELSDWHDFSGGTSSYDSLYVRIPAGGSLSTVLQWNDKFGSSSNDYDLYLYSENSQKIVAYSEMIQNGSGDPIEVINWFNDTGSAVEGQIWVYKDSGAAKTLEVFIYNTGLVYIDNITAADSIFGHPAVPGVIAVGAVDAATPNQIEPYSSQGPVTIRYPSSQTRSKPDISATDGVSVTGVGGFGSPFLGTSASAPHVAAIAALVWSKFPAVTAEEIRTMVVNGAVDLGSSGTDYVFGSGRADALSAIPPYRDLIVQSIDGPDTGGAGGTISVTNTIKNQGNSATSAAFYVKYYLSADATITSSDILLGQRSVAAGLAAGASSTNTTNLTIPATLAGGSYYVGAIADATNTVSESDENNNTGYDAGKFTVTAISNDTFPNNSVIIWSKAYSIDYLMDESHIGEINQAIGEAGSHPIYFQLSGVAEVYTDVFTMAAATPAALAALPEIEYKDAQGNKTTYAAGFGCAK